MKSKILYFASFCAGCLLLVQACSKTEDPDSVAKPTSLPFIAYTFLEDVYIYGQGNTHIYTDLPNVIGVAVDSVLGFAGGYGGKTGQDSIKIYKSELSFGDTVSVGGSGFFVYKYNQVISVSTLAPIWLLPAQTTTPAQRPWKAFTKGIRLLVICFRLARCRTEFT